MELFDPAEKGGQLSGEARCIQLKKQDQVVSEQLERCREKFNDKIQSLEERKKKLQMRETDFKMTLKNYETRLRELEGKKEDASVNKAETVNTIHVKNQEIKKLADQLEALKRRKDTLKTKVAHGAKFDRFLNTVLSFKPDEFSDVKDIIARSATLTETRKMLLEKLSDAAEEKKRLEFENERNQQRKTDEIILLRMKQDELERQLQGLVETNRIKEKQCASGEDHSNENQAKLGNIIKSSTNMHIIIQKYKSQPEQVKDLVDLFGDEESTTPKQLVKIKQYLEDLEDILEDVGKSNRNI